MRCVCKHCWMNPITQIIHKAATLSAFKTRCCQSTLTWKCRIFMAKVHVMFHYECALPQTNTFVNNQTTLSLQAQANEVWELMHHNGILVALQHYKMNDTQTSFTLCCRDEHGSGLDRTGSGLKPILAGSELDRTAIFFQNWRIRTGSDWEYFCCFNVIILKISKILVVIRFHRFAKR